MKIKILFICLMSLFAFCMGQYFSENPKCQQVETDKPLKKTTFIFNIDRDTVWKTSERWMYILKQITCMVPNSNLVDFGILDYSHYDPELHAHIDWNKVSQSIFGYGLDRESWNYGYCDRLRNALNFLSTTMRQRLEPIENIQFIFPIIADADDASDCSLVDVFNEFFKNYPDKSNIHFNAVYIQGVSDAETRRNSSIFLDIPDITVINIDMESMVKSQSKYARRVKPIVDALAAFIDSKAYVHDDVSTTPVPDINHSNFTSMSAALVEEDDNSHLLLVIIVLFLIICALVMIITIICCWAIMCNDSRKKKKESRTRSASKENILLSKDANGRTPKKGKATPPRVSLSGMDSIDEFYIEPSAENTRTPQTKTPITATPQIGNTPKKPSYEDLDVSDRKNDDVEQQGGRKRGYRNQKPPADFMVE